MKISKIKYGVIMIMAVTMTSFTMHYTSSIYTKQFTTLTGTQKPIAAYQGKKILIVNIASASELAPVQLTQLEQLYQQYKDSLEIVAFPSNDFGNEPMSNADLQQLLQNTYHISFPVSIVSGVKDSTASTHSIYQWLQRESENGSMSPQVKGDFQKFFIDKSGNLTGVFSGRINPSDSSIINIITQ
ncbi:MAG: hypothetical protein JST86_01890 [Bacteroidetes bacterium]|nr:hypothetical protein [Bacteroidota bacterium]